MKIHLRADCYNPRHTRITVFLDGANCGQLCMPNEDAGNFHQIVSLGCVTGVDEFLSTGRWGDVSEDQEMEDATYQAAEELLDGLCDKT